MKFPLILLALLSPSLLTAAPANIAATCGEWVDARQQHEAQPTTYWLQGFIAAYNEYQYTGKNPNGIMGNAKETDIAKWLDNYCQKHPQSNPQGAIESLIEERKPAEKACPVRRSGGRPCPRPKKEEIPEIGR